MHQVLLVLAELVLPPFSPFFLLLLALCTPARLRRVRVFLSTLAVLSLWALSTIGVSEWLVPAKVPPTHIQPPYEPAEAIVVLGAGRHLLAPEYPDGETISGSTLERLRYGAKLARETGRPLLLSGGRQLGMGKWSEAELMRDVLETEWHLSARWIESRSETTAQNAMESAALLHAAGIENIYLVTHSIHMERAKALFEAEDIEVVPMPTVFVPREALSLRAWLPSFRGLARNRQWLYERMSKLAG